jgi:hypothetical protein
MARNAEGERKDAAWRDTALLLQRRLCVTKESLPYGFLTSCIEGHCRETMFTLLVIWIDGACGLQLRLELQPICDDLLT